MRTKQLDQMMNLAHSLIEALGVEGYALVRVEGLEERIEQAFEAECVHERRGVAVKGWVEGGKRHLAKIAARAVRGDQ